MNKTRWTDFLTDEQKAKVRALPADDFEKFVKAIVLPMAIRKTPGEIKPTEAPK